MKTRIHVDPKVIADNFRYGICDPPIVVYEHGHQVKNAHVVRIDGPSVIVHDNKNPMASGARVWIETDAEIFCD